MVEPEPLVSICITTFQHAAYIERCIRSVLDQDVAGELEVLVGDDGSLDGTREIIDRMARSDARVRPFFHADRLGPSGNLSNLVSRSRGTYVAHLDGDDYWQRSKLRLQLHTLDDPDVAAVYSNATVVTPDDHLLGQFNRSIPERVDLGELLRRGNMLCHSSLVYRRTAIDAVLGMRPPYIDYRVHIRLLRHGALAYVDQPLVAYRWRTPGSMIRTLPDAVSAGHIDAFREALHAGARARDVRAAASRFFGRSVFQCIIGGDPRRISRVAREIRQIEGLSAGWPWLLMQAVMAPFHAVHSVLSRRHGVNFP